MIKGNKYMNRDGVNKVVSPSLFEQFLQDGWRFGNTNASTGGGRHTKGLKYFNNGVIEVRRSVCPDGFSAGRLPMSDSCKKKIGESNSKALLGKKHSEESKIKVSESLKGHLTSDETKAKISIANRGKTCSAKGKHWFTDGTTCVLSYECPDGFTLGKLPVGDDVREKISKSLTGRKRAVSEDKKDSWRQTNLDRYGVEWTLFLGRKCGNKKDSSPNVDFRNLLSGRGIDFEREYRVGSFFYDFKLGGTLIEIDPYPTHNVNWNPYNGKPVDKFYHERKSKCAIENGFRCIHIFDWDDPQKVLSTLSDRETCYARNCDVKEISKQISEDFLEKNHLQGYCKCSVKLGLYFDGNLISVMTFSKPRYNKNYEWELARYCSTHNVIGGAEKLFSHFIKKHSPKSIISYCDLSKFSGSMYQKLGFSKLGNPMPSRHWYNGRTNTHITDNLLRQRGFDQLFGTSYGKGYSNEELMRNNGFVEIYDCGQQTYIWKKL